MDIVLWVLIGLIWILVGLLVWLAIIAPIPVVILNLIVGLIYAVIATTMMVRYET